MRVHWGPKKKKASMAIEGPRRFETWELRKRNQPARGFGPAHARPSRPSTIIPFAPCNPHIDIKDIGTVRLDTVPRYQKKKMRRASAEVEEQMLQVCLGC